MSNINILEKIIRDRRSVFPATYTDREITSDEIKSILENARWAPTHRLTQPWRFKVFKGKSLNSLSEYLGSYYKANTAGEAFSEMKLKKTMKKPLQSSCVLAICLSRDPEEKVPEWEEIASVAMAVQNIWLSCTARGIGSYWSSPASIIAANDFLGLQANEKCLGLFYMGYKKDFTIEMERKEIKDLIEWV